MIQQSVLGARVCIVQLLRVTRLNERICKHHVHIRSKLEWYLTASSLFFHARRLQEQSWPSAITSKLHVFLQGSTQKTIQQFNLRVVGVVPAPRMLDWYQILTKAKIDQVNLWLRCGPGWSKYFTLCGWQELQASMSKSAKAFTRKRISDKAARQSWLKRLKSNELWLSRHLQELLDVLVCSYHSDSLEVLLRFWLQQASFLPTKTVPIDCNYTGAPLDNFQVRWKCIPKTSSSSNLPLRFIEWSPSEVCMEFL